LVDKKYQNVYNYTVKEGNIMTQFFIGLLVGAVFMDLLWAWKLGIAQKVVSAIQLKIKLWKAKSL
jgi:hypothetical protein